MIAGPDYRQLYASDDPAEFRPVDDGRFDYVTGDGPERGIENNDREAGPLPDGNDTITPSRWPGPKKFGFGSPRSAKIRGKTPTLVCNIEAHIEVATTAGTANGRKKTVRKNVAEPGDAEIEHRGEEGRNDDHDGHLDGGKEKCPRHPRPESSRSQSLGVVGKAAEDRPANHARSEETGVDGINERDDEEHEEDDDKWEDEPQTPAGRGVVEKLCSVTVPVPPGRPAGRSAPPVCSSTPPMATWAKFALPRSK